MFHPKLLLVVGLLATTVAGHSVVAGYFCPACASTPDPQSALADGATYYDEIRVAFVGWKNDGTVINTINCADTPTPGQCTSAQLSFNFTAEQVKSLRTAGKQVTVAIGGGADGIIYDTAPPGFADKLASGVVDIVRQYGFDGVDFDIEHRMGDIEKCGSIINDIVSAIRELEPGIVLSIVPQMSNLNPEVTGIYPGINGLVPVISESIASFDTVGPQMYNSWAAVETAAYAEKYAGEVTKAWSATGASGKVYNVQVPAHKLMLGYPSSRSGASSGFLDPATLCSMWNSIRAGGLKIAGMYGWDLGWDGRNGWAFGKALHNCVK